MRQAWLQISITLIMLSVGSIRMVAAGPKVYDVEAAKELCDETPLDKVEGIWIYPDDGVTVLILQDKDNQEPNSFPVYTISVLDTSDTRLQLGEAIGRLYATAQKDTYKIELSTEKNNDILLKPKSCLATISKDSDALLIKKQKAPFKGRLNLNFSRLLPGFWKIVSMGVSSVPTGSHEVTAPVGMLKVYPSYDGNGSSRRKVRYL